MFPHHLPAGPSHGLWTDDDIGVVPKGLEKTPDADEDEKEVTCDADIIAFFAHKGGVSKTTNIHHIGYMLAKSHGKRVIMVDADPQCNLTQTLCKKAKHTENFRGDVPQGNIYKCIEATHRGQLPSRDLSPPQLISIHKARIQATGSGGELLLIPGSLELAKVEPQITFAHNVSNPDAFPIFDDIAGTFRRLFITTANAYDADIILIDMGPSIGEMNKNLFWSSDYFIIPCSPDAYCKTTMITMERTLPRWTEQQQRLADITKNMTMPLNITPPKFLGIIMGMFQVTGASKIPVKDSQLWMDIVKQQVRVNLVPALAEAGMMHEYQIEGHCLAEIPNFLSLMPLAQRLHYPVFDIPEDKMGSTDEDGVFRPMARADRDRHLRRSEYFRKLYDDASGEILNLLNPESYTARDHVDVPGGAVYMSPSATYTNVQPDTKASTYMYYPLI